MSSHLNTDWFQSGGNSFKGHPYILGQFATASSTSSPRSLLGYNLTQVANSSITMLSPSSAESGLSDYAPSPPRYPKAFLGPTFICQRCGEENSVKNKARHMKKHDKSPKPNHCKCVCGVPDFSRPDACERHMRRCKVAIETGELQRRDADKAEKRRRSRRKAQQRIPKAAAESFSVLNVDGMVPVPAEMLERPQARSSKGKLTSKSVPSPDWKENSKAVVPDMAGDLGCTVSYPDHLAPPEQLIPSVGEPGVYSAPAPLQSLYHVSKQALSQHTVASESDSECFGAHLLREQQALYGSQSYLLSEDPYYYPASYWQGREESLESLELFLREGFDTEAISPSPNSMLFGQAYRPSYGFEDRVC